MRRWNLCPKLSQSTFRALLDLIPLYLLTSYPTIIPYVESNPVIAARSLLMVISQGLLSHCESFIIASHSSSQVVTADPSLRVIYLLAKHYPIREEPFSTCESPLIEGHPIETHLSSRVIHHLKVVTTSHSSLRVIYRGLPIIASCLVLRFIHHWRLFITCYPSKLMPHRDIRHHGSSASNLSGLREWPSTWDTPIDFTNLISIKFSTSGPRS